MEAMQARVETWIKDQTSRIMKVTWGPHQWQWRLRWWPPWTSTEQRDRKKRLHLEYERRKKQIHQLCLALRVDSVSDLQEILCCMVLSECVYKRPAAELVRAVNKFKADFGGQVISLERVQPSADHVSHRYLLAEAGDTLFASFIGTKQYKDVMADANIFQGAIFLDDMEATEGNEATDSEVVNGLKRNVENSTSSAEPKLRKPKELAKPAAHRGFMARAKGIPALELYRLAQKKKRKLVLCGHSLGGAVAALATLAILRVICASSSSKESEEVQVKCITFSQPPVGNAALRDYVNTKGWKEYFRSYCIPEDLVPRILSPAYFHHYNSQSPLTATENEAEFSHDSAQKHNNGTEKLKKENENEQLVIGLGPVQNPFWRLSRLVPLESVKKKLNPYRGVSGSSSTLANNSVAPEDEAIEPQSLEIQEGSDGVSLKPLSDLDQTYSDKAMEGKTMHKAIKKVGDSRTWRGVPYLPSYVPFGQLYLLGNSSVEALSGSEYLKLTSVKSVIAEVRERFQSHSMKSYRSRFQRYPNEHLFTRKFSKSVMQGNLTVIYDLYMSDEALSFPGMDQFQQLPHLKQWLGLIVAGSVELGHIVESPVIRSATSIVPLGWSGHPGERIAEPFKVDVAGFGLHVCSLVHAQVNGIWCSTAVETFPSQPSHDSSLGEHELQKMRVLVGPPLKRQPKHHLVGNPIMPAFSSINSEYAKTENVEDSSSPHENLNHPENPINLHIFCTSDFTTASKEVHLRTRRVRLLGLEGAGKTSLFKAIMGLGRNPPLSNIENLLLEPDIQEVFSGGVCYSDSSGVNLQDLRRETSRFRDELWKGIRDLSRKTDLVVLVHNLSHRVAQYSSPSGSDKKPALSLLLDEAKSLGVPWILAITNKFSVSAHQQKAAVETVLHEYDTTPSHTEVVNSCPYVMPGAAMASFSWSAGNADTKLGAQRLAFSPMNLFRMPFQRKETILPIEGVNSLCNLVHRVLRSHEEASLEELARERLLVELARDRGAAIGAKDREAKSSLSAATVGASLGAGLGIVLALVMGAASALRKP